MATCKVQSKQNLFTDGMWNMYDVVECDRSSSNLRGEKGQSEGVARLTLTFAGCEGEAFAKIDHISFAAAPAAPTSVEL